MEVEDHTSESLHTQHPTTLCESAQYKDSPLSESSSLSCQKDRHASSSTKDEPAMVLSLSSEAECERVLATSKNVVVVTGTAAMGKVGRPIGSIDIAESEDTYLFRIALPGVARDKKTFSCDVAASGKVLIKGMTLSGSGRTIHKHNMIFQMQSQNLCPAGGFSIMFQLPGPIDPLQLTAVFGSNGIFEGIVKKKPPEN